MADSESRLRSEAVFGVVEIYTRRDRPRTSKFLSIFSDGRDKPEPMVVAPVDLQVFRSLARLLKDSDRNVRESAAEAIGILGGTEVAVDLVAALGDAEADVRALAVTALVKVGTSADGEALSPLIADPSSSVRRRAIAGLGRLKVGEAAAGLRRLFARSPDSEDGILALSSLAQLALPEDRALFERLVLQADVSRRRYSIEGLARLGAEANEASFKRAFQRERNEELRAAYAFAIFLFGDRPFIDTVILGLGGSNHQFRQSRGYVEEFGARALPEALDYLQEPDAKIRAGLCDALANVGVVGALPAIEPLVKDRDRQVAASAARAVAILRRQRSGSYARPEDDGHPPRPRSLLRATSLAVGVDVDEALLPRASGILELHDPLASHGEAIGGDAAGRGVEKIGIDGVDAVGIDAREIDGHVLDRGHPGVRGRLFKDDVFAKLHPSGLKGHRSIAG